MSDMCMIEDVYVTSNRNIDGDIYSSILLRRL